ncbi:MAG: 16S rRNA (cytosine(1402)-N(4))-methyltransferase RsmH [Chlorobi bacterium]|nr:16S rRNA (cytosine(1402)-N(4))-methyltransferase RsmH [Chlorobiota bacterium]
MNEQYHIPVLLKESVDGLDVREGGIYVDLTFGGGGHSREILSRLGNGKLVVFDQDEDAYRNRPDDNRLVFVRHNFRYLTNFLRYLGIEQVDGILGDLGVSSHHFDDASRGFSFRHSGALDMRMNGKAGKDAASVLNNYEEKDLKNIFYNYGEIKNAGRLVKEIAAFRHSRFFETTDDLKQVAEKTAPKKDVSKYLAKVFQALRIEVNGEMTVLEETLMQIPSVLKKGGRVSIISYHSLEDRLVKNFIKTGDCRKSQIETDMFGNADVPLKAVNRKVIVPSDEEIEKNNRARSAKLRIAERR